MNKKTIWKNWLKKWAGFSLRWIANSPTVPFAPSCSYRLFASKKKKAHVSRPAERYVCLRVEVLEVRTVPTIVFNPHFGPEQILDDGGTKLNDPHVYLVFWGAYWQSAGFQSGSQMAMDIQNATASLFSSPYLSGLTQYGVDGHAQLANVVFDGSAVPTSVSSDQIKTIFNNQIDNNNLPEADDTFNLPIYVVLTPPGTTSSDQPAAEGYHSADHDTDFFDSDLMPFAWVGSSGVDYASQVDRYTKNLSHEVVEAITDPFPKAPVIGGINSIQSNFPTPRNSTEICDWEPDGGLYYPGTKVAQFFCW